MAWEPLPSSSRPMQKLGGTLDDVLRRLSGPSAKTTVDVFTQWPDVVGERVADHCRPLRLDGKELILEVHDAAWASELKWMENDLLEKIRVHTGTSELERIRVRVQPAGS